MKYRIFLRMKIQESNWMTMGDNHIILWNIRDLIAASSGWFIMNEESVGLACALIPKLQKGILELTQSSNTYANYEISHGMGTIQDVLDFYKDLLKDCQQHPYTELFGSIIA